MAIEALVQMNRTHGIAAMAVDAERGDGNGCAVVMAMARWVGAWGGGEKVSAVADDTLRVWCDSNNQWSVKWVL